jgi:outer membrane protein OmpA-like peptidoglycan-associated protein
MMKVCNLTFSLFLIFIPSFLKAQDKKDIPVWSFDILFDFGKSDLKPEYFGRLDTVARGMAKDSLYVIELEAHTDSIGTEQANMKLSAKRALAIEKYLMGQGVDSARVDFKWFGESQPISENITEGGRQRNRRVRVSIIKRFTLVTISGIIEDDTGRVVPNAQIITRHRYFTDTTTTDSSGNYTLRIPKRQDILLDIIAKNYFFETQPINVSTSDIKVPKIKLFRAMVGRKMKIKDLYYVGNQAVILEKSLPELKNVLRFMLLNDDYKIEIQGHINLPGEQPVPIGSESYELSVKRAKVVYDFLRENGVDENRMIYKGYGNWEMVYPNAKTEYYQAFNRRVEIKILNKKQAN